MSDYNFSAQYQQQPIPVGGALIKSNWFKYYDPHELPGRYDMTVLSLDTANKTTELSDYSVATHDDQVDSTIQAIGWYKNNSRVNIMDDWMDAYFNRVGSH